MNPIGSRLPRYVEISPSEVKSDFCLVCRTPLSERQVVAHHGPQEGISAAICQIHKTCLQEWAATKALCPNCQTSFDLSSIFSWHSRIVNRIKQVFSPALQFLEFEDGEGMSWRVRLGFGLTQTLLIYNNMVASPFSTVLPFNFLHMPPAVHSAARFLMNTGACAALVGAPAVLSVTYMAALSDSRVADMERVKRLGKEFVKGILFSNGVSVLAQVISRLDLIFKVIVG